MKTINESTLISIQVVCIIVGIAIWIVRLSDKVDNLEIRVARLEAVK